MKTKRALSRIYSISCLLPALFLLTAEAYAAPEVEATLAAQTVTTGAPFALTVTVFWQGDAEQYIVAPPQPELPEGIELVSSSFSSSVRADEQRLQYSFILRAAGEGQFTLKPISIKYWARGQQNESTVQSRDIIFTAARFPFLKNRQALVIGGSSAAVVAAACLALFLVRRQRRKKNTAACVESPAQKIAALLQDCRSSKLQGDFASFYETAIDLNKLLPEQDSAQTERLAAMLEKVRFGGQRPPADEVERLMRQLEKGAEKILSAGKDARSDYEKYCRKD